MRYWLFIPTIVILVLCHVAVNCAEKDNEKFDPAMLKDLPANTWIDLGLSWRGGNEMPAIFDAANQLFFKYGGCGDHSPKTNVEGSKRRREGYGNSCWAVNMATGGWEMRRPNDVSFPKERTTVPRRDGDRPDRFSNLLANFCPRGIAGAGCGDYNAGTRKGGVHPGVVKPPSRMVPCSRIRARHRPARTS